MRRWNATGLRQALRDGGRQIGPADVTRRQRRDRVAMRRARRRGAIVGRRQSDGSARGQRHFGARRRELHGSPRRHRRREQCVRCLCGKASRRRLSPGPLDWLEPASPPARLPPCRRGRCVPCSRRIPCGRRISLRLLRLSRLEIVLALHFLREDLLGLRRGGLRLLRRQRCRLHRRLTAPPTTCGGLGRRTVQRSPERASKFEKAKLRMPAFLPAVACGSSGIEPTAFRSRDATRCCAP